MLKTKQNITVILFMLLLCQMGWAQSESIFSEIEEAIGGKDKWEQTDYLYFTVSGNNRDDSLPGKRSFLINKSNGDARFKGMNDKSEEIVLLFNFVTQGIKRIFINEEEKGASEEENQAVVELVQKQFLEDINLLFSPILVIAHGDKNASVQPKIVNGEKFSFLEVEKFSYLPEQKSRRGSVAVDPEGKIRIINLGSDKEVTVSKYVDTGGGLKLPTRFDSQTKPSQSCEFSTVASFTDIQDKKFEEL